MILKMVYFVVVFKAVGHVGGYISDIIKILLTAITTSFVYSLLSYLQVQK